MKVRKYIWILLILVIPFKIVIADDSCQEVSLEQCGPNNQENVPNPQLGCYECSKGSNKVYTQSFSIDDAEIVTGGNNCQTVEMDNKNVIQNDNVKCYKCNLKYTQALNEEDALEVIGGMNGQERQEMPQRAMNNNNQMVGREKREINTNVIKILGAFGIALVVLVLSIFLSKYNNN